MITYTIILCNEITNYIFYSHNASRAGTTVYDKLSVARNTPISIKFPVDTSSY